MSNLASQFALRQYEQVKTTSAVVSSDGYRLVQLLLEGVLERLAIAKGHMERGEVAEKGERLGRVLDIIAELRGTLDHESGGDIARNLHDLYDYMESLLIRANIENRTDLLDQLSSLVREIKSGWDGLGSVPSR